MSTNEKQLLHDRLASAVAPLVKPPFGTGAAVTGVLGAVESTAALGTVSDGGPAVGNGTRFNVASVSKVLTAARIISLAHAKVIGVDDPVAKHLPGVKLIDKGGVDRAGTITVRQLVQHRSGLPQVPKDLALLREVEPDVSGGVISVGVIGVTIRAVAERTSG